MKLVVGLVLVLLLFLWLRAFSHVGRMRAYISKLEKEISQHKTLMDKQQKRFDVTLQGFKNRVEFESLSPAVKAEILEWVDAVAQSKIQEQQARQEAKEAEFWQYLRTNLPDWFTLMRCSCGAELDQPRRGKDKGTRIPPRPPVLQRDCPSCKQILDLNLGPEHLEFRKRHGLWRPI